jgi:hypothetical protein
MANDLDALSLWLDRESDRSKTLMKDKYNDWFHKDDIKNIILTLKQNQKKMSLISNNQTDLEKFFKSRNMIITILTATSLLQAVHTAMVIANLTFIGDGFWAWLHSALLAICVELYIVIFSIRGNHKLAVMYLWFAIFINIGMSYIQHDLSFRFFFYALITTIFPLSVYYTALELAKKHSDYKPQQEKSELPAKVLKKRGRKRKVSQVVDVNK